MKVFVDSYPESPRDCLFSKQIAYQNYEPVYACTLRDYIPEADEKDNGYKPKCVCRNVKNCDKLIKMNG